MPYPMELLAEGLVIAGIVFLTIALNPVRQVIAQLPSGKVRRRWYILAALIGVFIVAYIGYAVVFWGRHTAWPEFIVPGVFFFGAGFVWMIAVLSVQTAIGLRRVALLEQEAITDPLLGIYNRRYLDRRLEEETARARRYASPLSVLMVDIDHFKRVNDTYGHQVGDLVLSYLGKLLLQTIRQSDIAARYGGEEMLIITPHTDTPTAGALADRIRQHIEAHKLVVTNQFNKPQEIRITVSIGVAGLNPGVPDSQQLLHNADQALYRAKQSGRNRVIVAGDNAPPAP